jgi:prefoldin subunit 5
MSNDAERILEAIDGLTQQLANLEQEMSGLRADVQQMAIGQDIAKKKRMPLSGNCMAPLSNWQS